MSSQPGTIDPNTIDVDNAPTGGPTIETLAATSGSKEADGYQYMQVFNARNGLPVGYLASSKNAAVWITQDKATAAKVKIDKGNHWFVRKKTTPFDRFLGVMEYSYACWGLSGTTYTSYIKYHADHTISLENDQNKKLTGPYRSVGTDWAWWADAADDNVLRCELVD